MKRASWAVVKISGKPPARPGDAVGHRDGGALVHHRQLGLPAAAHHRHHPVAAAEPRTPGPTATTSPAELEAGHVGGHTGRRRVEAETLEHVGAVEPGGAHRHEQLAGARAGIGVLAPLELPSTIVTACTRGAAFNRAAGAVEVAGAERVLTDVRTRVRRLDHHAAARVDRHVVQAAEVHEVAGLEVGSRMSAVSPPMARRSSGAATRPPPAMRTS